MKLSDYKGEAALDVLADIIEPLTLVMADDEIQKLAKAKAPVLKFVKPALKNHKKEIIEILARIENEPIDEYKEKVSVFTLPVQILDLLNEPEVQKLFQSQAQIPVTPLASSTPAMENTEAAEN